MHSRRGYKTPQMGNSRQLVQEIRNLPKNLPSNGIKNLLVICPGFASDCVETLEEIDIQGRESFIKNGGKNFDLIPCLNDTSDHINLFEKLVKQYI